MKKLVLVLIGVALFIINGQTQTVTDIDGNVYNTVNIGNQTWMKENLKVTHYNDGGQIYNGNSYGSWYTIQAVFWCYYDTNHINNDLYGKLYNFFTIMMNPNVCPLGWRVPTMVDIDTLCSYFNALTIGGDLKESDSTFWAFPNVGANNISGFSGRGGGVRNYHGEFDSLKVKGKWWTSDMVNENGVLYGKTFSLFNYHASLEKSKSEYHYGASIRCIKDTNSSGVYEIPKINLLISPNPFTQSTLITLNQTYHNIALAVYDIQGKRVAQQQYTDADKILFHRNQLHPGLYFLKLTLDDKAAEVRKIVISD